VDKQSRGEQREEVWRGGGKEGRREGGKEGSKRIIACIDVGQGQGQQSLVPGGAEEKRPVIIRPT